MDQPNVTKPNVITMVDAIVAEELAAFREKRTPRLSKAIELFRQRTKRKLTQAQEEELFAIVFAEYAEISGAKIGSTNN